MFQLTEDTSEQILHLFNESGPVCLGDVTFIDPYGMVGILEIGELLKLQGIKKTLCLPQSDEVIKYLERMDFFKFAGEYFNEHSENKGFVGIQKYHFQNLNRNIVKIAVMDIGIGFRKSLSERFVLKSDLQAVEKALLQGASRYADEGRGHGLSAVRRFVNQWNGRLSIRSGTAKLCLIPEWARGKEKEVNLTYFPGAQINIMLSEV